MTKWAFLTVLLYISLVVLLFIPVVLLVVDIIAGGGNSFLELFGIYGYWPFWLTYGVMVLIQVLLLIFPVAKYKDRPKPQRAIWVPVITSAFLFTILFSGFVVSVAAGIGGDYVVGTPVSTLGILGLIVFSWAIWAIVFYRFGRIVDRESFVEKITRWLIKGSIVELLVAIPCHIIVRHKNYCCAPGLTFFGIAAGLVIMAFAFGPGIFFLFLKRFRKLQPKIEHMAT
ncbi:MAG: hypothetical protein ACYS6K_09135 [Planctomycetota bacterium]|jgi:hypothetical protein